MKQSLPMAWMLLIAYFSLIPGGQSLGPPNQGIYAHFFAYLVLCCLLYYWPLAGEKALLISVSYGFLIEVLQTGVPGRAFQLADIAANSIGSLSFLVAAWVAKKQAFYKQP